MWYNEGMTEATRLLDEALAWEREWWGDCVNTLGEELKQTLYARKMGLRFFDDGKTSFNIDMSGLCVLDIGGGPVSLLLKCVNLARAKVVDPLGFPTWVLARYAAADIDFEQVCAEDIAETGWDECWLYNVLPHVERPRAVIRRARRAARIIRVFDWIDTAPSAGHPCSVSEEQLNAWLQGEGRVELINEGGCKGKAYYGVFPA